MPRVTSFREHRRPTNAGLDGNLDQSLRWKRTEINQGFEDHLHGDYDPRPNCKTGKPTMQHEKPVHRLMQEMHMEGYSIREIASATKYCEEQVSTILRQPWARKRMIEQAKKGVKETLSAVLEELALPTLKEIVALGNKQETPAATQLACKQEVLNRFLGRPTQPIVQEQKDPKSLTNEELQAEVAKVLAAQPAEGLTFNDSEAVQEPQAAEAPIAPAPSSNSVVGQPNTPAFEYQ